MMNLIIIAIMIVTLMSAAAYGLLSVMRNLQTSIDTLIIQDRLEEASQAVIANIVPVSGVYYVPAPDVLTAPAVPSWVTPNAQTPRGVKFLYCPFSNVLASSGSTITTTGSNTYTVTTGTLYSGTNIASNNYVYNSAISTATQPTNAPSALAILVAPGPGQSAVLTTQDCLNVTAAGTLPGASVRIITEQEVQSKQQVIASAGTEFYAASSTSGDGKGSSTSNYATFATVMDYINKFRPQRATVNLKPSDTITVASTDLDQSSVTTREFSSIRNSSLAIVAAGGTTPQGSYTQYTNTSSLQPGTNLGTLSPVVLGNLYFRDISFPAVTGSVIQPSASFGNIILSYPAGTATAPYAAANSYNKIIINQPFNISSHYGTTKMSTPSGTLTGNQFYTSIGGTLEIAPYMTLDGSSVTYPVPQIYNDAGGNTINVGTLKTGIGNNSALSPVIVGSGANYYLPATGWLYISPGGSDTKYSGVFQDFGSKFTQTGVIMDNGSSKVIYNRGGIYAISSANNIMNGISAANTIYYNASQAGAGSIVSKNAPYILAAGPGANFYMSSGAFLNFTTPIANSASIFANNSTSQDTMGILGGGNVFAFNFSSAVSAPGLNQSTTNSVCIADQNALSPISDSSTSRGGTAILPLGNIGMEASSILNRTAAVCN